MTVRTGTGTGTGASLSPITSASAASAHPTNHSTGTTVSARTPDGWDKEEIVRLLLQQLESLGLNESVAALSRETGLSAEDSSVRALRTAIESGKWDVAEARVALLDFSSQDHDSALFVIRRQKYLEALEEGDVRRALAILRSELANLNMNPEFASIDRPAEAGMTGEERLHALSGLVMCRNPGEVRERAGWAGVAGGSRSSVLHDIQRFIPPEKMLPAHRLETLFDQALAHQESVCKYHNTLNLRKYLYADHRCTPDDVPRHTTHILREHIDEVWFLAYSPSGRYLASTSKDMTCILWDTRDWRSKAILTTHADVIAGCAWSPDEERILTCGNDKQLIMWSVPKGRMERAFRKHSEAVTACAWLPDGRSFISGSLDGLIIQWSALDGSILHSWKGEPISDINIGASPDGHRCILIAATSEMKVRVIDLRSLKEITVLEDTSILTGCIFDRACENILLNLKDGGLHLWNLEKRTIVGHYIGHTQNDFVIRGCFGGPEDNFIASGSTDGHIYIWLRQTGELVDTLHGHTGVVSMVVWNPANPREAASASDDGTVRIWTSDASS